MLALILKLGNLGSTHTELGFRIPPTLGSSGILVHIHRRSSSCRHRRSRCRHSLAVGLISLALRESTVMTYTFAELILVGHGGAHCGGQDGGSEDDDDTHVEVGAVIARGSD